MALQVSVTSDLYVAGRTEDGDAYTAEAYFVMAEAEDGSRLFHSVAFRGCEARWDAEEGFAYFRDIREETRGRAQALADRISVHLAAGGRLCEDHWVEGDPAYGSEAFQAKDRVGYFAAREVVDAVDAGEAVSFDLESSARMVLDRFD